jgi:DNA polymerase III epsilon subunit-like protein
MKVVLADFESHKGNSSNKSWIHTICALAVNLETGSSHGIVIKIDDVLRNPIIKECERVNKKHADDTNACSSCNIKVTYHKKFADAFKFLVKFINENGGVLITHNLLSDLEFLVSTQELVGGTRVIKRKLREYPDTGTYVKGWESIIKACSMSILCNRCPKMNIEYKKFNTNFTAHNRPRATLESYTQFAKGNDAYIQKHSAVQDTLDLFCVLRCAYRFDGKFLDGHSYLASAAWLAR